MIRGFDATAAAVEHAELEGFPGVTTGVAELATVGGLEVGVWEHSPGRSTDTEADEVFIVLSGRGTVTCDSGGRIDLAPGVVGLLPAGARTVWEVTEPLRKVWIVPAAPGAP